MLRKFWFVALTLLATLGFDPVKADFVGTMIGGHVDIGLELDGTGLSPHIHKHDGAELTLFDGTTFSGPEIEFAPADLWFGVRAGRTNFDGTEDPIFRRPAGNWDFLGVAQDEQIWVLPIVEQANRPFVGFSAEELTGFSDVTVTINSITARNGIGNSTFSVFKVGNDGQPTEWASSTAVAVEDRQFLIPGGAHDHFFMAFTGEGVFDVSLSFAATRIADSLSANGSAAFTFAVGEPNFASVPEPTSFTLLACGTVLLGVRRWRRKSQSA